MLIAIGGSIILHTAVLGMVMHLSSSAQITTENEAVERVFISFDRQAPLPLQNEPAAGADASQGDDAPGALPSFDVLTSVASIGAVVAESDASIDLVQTLLGETGGGALDTEALRFEEAVGGLGGGMPEVGFAGLGASNARSVVYVVDASGPMVGTLPIVVDELERSLLALDPAQEFQVVFVNGDISGAGYVVAPPTGKLIRALPGEVRRVVGWCRTVRAHGRSDPVPALERALAMRPDAVFLFSRVSSYIGVYEQNRESRLALVRSRVLSRLDGVNPRSAQTGRRRTVIKVVQFHEQDPSGLFRAIAREHGGGLGGGVSGGVGEGDAYRFITREDGLLR